MNIARITQSHLTRQELLCILADLKSQQVKLVYWPSDCECEAALIKQCGGHLADKKTTFVINFSTIKHDDLTDLDPVKPLTGSIAIADIECLAIQSGEYSRFATDVNIPKDKFITLYKIWINRALHKEMADEILITGDAEKVVGLISLGEKNGKGDIGLMAVDTQYRGRHYGERLVRAAQKWFIAQGYQQGQVVTQGHNLPACNLYKKCGYWIEKIEYFYHFWL